MVKCKTMHMCVFFLFFFFLYFERSLSFSKILIYLDNLITSTVTFIITCLAQYLIRLLIVCCASLLSLFQSHLCLILTLITHLCHLLRSNLHMSNVRLCISKPVQSQIVFEHACHFFVVHKLIAEVITQRSSESLKICLRPCFF